MNFNKIVSSKELFAFIPKGIRHLSYVGNVFETEKGLSESILKYFTSLETLNGEKL